MLSELALNASHMAWQCQPLQARQALLPTRPNRTADLGEQLLKAAVLHALARQLFILVHIVSQHVAAKALREGHTEGGVASERLDIPVAEEST